MDKLDFCSIKKINKLIKDPNLFFYDLFRKRLGNRVNACNQKLEVAYSVEHSINYDEIVKHGIVNYFRYNLNAGCCVRNEHDYDSVIIWSGHLTLLVNIVSVLKKMSSMSMKIYTLNGGYHVETDADVDFNIRKIILALSKRSDFVVELSNQINESYVFNVYLYDVDSDGLATVRSRYVLAKKFHVDEMHMIYNKNERDGFSVDAVYTWVNQADLEWQRKWLDTFPESEFDPDRFTDNDELKYSLRSINKYAKWINKIYIVSNCSKPSWLKNNPRIEWVFHNEIYPSENMLPTFNSHSIECCLHNINNLSEHFIYFNDDVVLGQPCLKSDFFDDIGRSISYYESYGMVYDGSIRENIPDYMKASINSCRLLKKIAPEYSARNLTRHVPHALKKSVLQRIDECFNVDINRTRHSKIRSDTDVNLTSFLYHHYSFITKESVSGDIKNIIIRPSNIKRIVDGQAFSHKIMCFNDGAGSAMNKNYKAVTKDYLNRRFSEPAPWEKEIRD
ncbi:stealth conserved region 3 domain-containing protein [Kluyvera sp. CHPC 1.2972]|uniref:stealth conserved region 3 domain-containing protein n=1 Tax=Kluyvera sp. CHPC 1.2972 TaxID=2995176 RepID=UPI002FD7C12C